MTDKQYLKWIRTLPSCLDGHSYSEWVPELGEWRNPACHVRRAGYSGMAYKAEFSCVPLTHTQHRYQHDHGELACLMKFCRDAAIVARLKAATPAQAERIAGEWFDAQVEKYRQRWITETPEGKAWAEAQRVEVIV